MPFVRLVLVFAVFGLTIVRTATAADLPRALPEGQLPADWRLQPPKDLNGYFPFQPPQSRAEWDKRSADVRRQMLVALGLWPMPTKTPLNAVIHGKIERDDYTVEKAYFESLPGFYVTGNLYRPKGQGGAAPKSAPGVLCPHGHWSQGRFYDCGEQQVRKQIEQGAEKFEEGGRSALQARCVQLARMGCTVFHYDMIGYADSVQISYEVAHRFAKQRPEMNTPDGWGLFSPQAESNLQSVMGLQTINSIRALDFVESLPEVDPQRIAVTGASGGGTQTFILAAVDPRPAVAVPAVMVSTAMQGGCTCENACLLRIGMGNVEFAGLFGPKPLGLTAANDWTKEMETKGFPELQQLYEVLGEPQNVMLEALLHFGHNYNAVSRAAMYRWFNRHLNLGIDEPIEERDFVRLTKDEMTVWTSDGDHPRPEGGPDFEKKLLRWLAQDSRGQMAELTPRDATSLARFRDAVGSAVDAIVGRRLPPVDKIDFQLISEEEKDTYAQIAGLTRCRVADDRTEELPTVVLVPKTIGDWAVVWVDAAGKDGLFAADGSLREEVRALLAANRTVISADLLYQGEFLADGKAVTQTRRVQNPREAAAYTFGYNHTLMARRVHDVLSLITMAQNGPGIEKVDVCGFGRAGVWVALARAQAGNAVSRAAVDTQAFRFINVKDIHSPDFLPGGAKYGDLPGILALSAPHDLWLAGEKAADITLVRAAYQAAGQANRLTVHENETPPHAAAVKWLLEGE